MDKKKKDICELFCYNKKKVNAIKKSIISDNKIINLTDIFKILGDSTRTKILLALYKNELCVCDVSHILGLSLSAVSHQLRMLRSFRLVKYRNEGKMAFYSLDDEHIMKLIDEGIKHISKPR